MYTRYFQKSKIFLYPLIGFNAYLKKPIETYLAIKGKYKVEDKVIICRYSFKRYNQYQDILIENKNYIEHFVDGDDHFLVYSLKELGDNYSIFLKGCYSEFDEITKYNILKFYLSDSKAHSIIEKYLYPKRYHYIVAEEMDIDVAILQEVVELCSKPDLNREIYETQSIVS